jgi:hypothetical protein
MVSINITIFIISSLIVLLIVLFIYIKQQKILVAICCIDERVLELQNCIHCLKTKDMFNKDIIGLFRKKDIKCKETLSHSYLEVDDYELSTTTRHNLTGLINKRNLALEYARNNNYDKLIFIDSDIEVNNFTLPCLLFGTIFADISCVAYPVRWANMLPVVGFYNPPSIQIINYGLLPFQKCDIAGTGCTCIDINSKKIPDKFIYGEITGPGGYAVFGEDIGFFIEAKKNDALVLVSTWNIVNHKY